MQLNTPALTVTGRQVGGSGAEDIGLALTAIAPGNATRRYSGSVVHWRPPVHGRAPWFASTDYNSAERQPLRPDGAALLAELPIDVRASLSDIHGDLCRPLVATLEPMGWMAGADWTPEIGFAPDRDPSIVPLDVNDPGPIPLRHDSNAGLRGFLLVAADQSRANSILGEALPQVAEVAAYIGDETAGAPSGLDVARVFWGADAELRFKPPGMVPLSVSQIFTDPVSGRPLLHGYQVATEGLRFTIDRERLDRFVDAVVEELSEAPGRRRWHEAQFLRYIVESRGRAIGIAGYDARLGADIIAAAAGHPAFGTQLRRLGRFWSPEALKTLLVGVRNQLLSQHPMMTLARVERAADALGVDGFHPVLTEALREARDDEALRAYLRSTILHGLALRLKLLVTQVGQGDERQLLSHVRLPLQFGEDSDTTITVCEAGAHGDGTVRGVIDNWDSVATLVGSGFLDACPNADEDAMVRRFWQMSDRHNAWRQIDPRDAIALATIASELESGAEKLPPVLTRILFAQEAVEAESFALYDLALDIECVRARVLDGLERPITGWELASAAIEAATSGGAAVLARLYTAYDAHDPNAEGSMMPAARVAEQVFRLAAPLCADGCRSCVHQQSDLMSDSLVEASVSRSLLQGFLASGL